MPKQLHNGKQKKLCVNNEINKINGAITKRAVTDKQLASFLYETYYDFAKCHDSLGRSALHLAASCGRTELCQWLINMNGANINGKDWESGYTAVQRALFYGHIKTAIRLMQMGADMSLMDKEGLTTIDLVIKDRPKQIVINSQVPCQVYIWGSNDNYTLGTGTNKSRKAPDLLDNFKRRNVSIKQVCMDEFHSVFVSSCSRVWMCGNGQGGRLGIPAERHVLTPRILGIGGEPCLMAAIALNHTLILLSNGTVLAFGQNDYYQLGLNPYVKECLSPKPVSFKQSHELITGVCAGKYHSVFYGKTTIFTCGLNGGQLGHPHIENSPFLKVPSQVPVNLKSGSYITQVSSSSTCIVFSLSTGEVFILNQFQFKKIASKQLDVRQIATAGGSLQTKVVHENNGVLKVVLLNSGGTIQIWQESVPHLIRCMFGLSRLISISHIFLNEHQILFTTKDGEAFRGTIGQIEKQKVNALQENKSGFNIFIEKSECYHISTSRISNIHRAVSITSDPKGKNLAVIQVHPHNYLTDIPIQNTENVTTQFLLLLNEASELDSLHDIIFKVQDTLFPVHEFIVASNSSTFLSLPRQGKLIQINDIPSVIFKEILTYMYSGWCSLFNEGPLSFSMMCEKEDPIKCLLEACNKYKVSSMYKKTACFRYENGCVRLKDCSIKPVCEQLKLNRDSFPELYDVEVSSEDGKLLKAHKCVLAARLDYFHSMLTGGWLEATSSPVLHLECPSKTLEVLLNFLYTNEIPESVYCDGFESLGRLLVISDQILCNDLKDYCEVFLVNSLNLKNAATMLQLSFLYNTTQLKNTVMQFISLNLETILENRSLEDLSDEILLELDKYHRQFNAATFDKRIITPYSDHTISDEIILSCASVDWPEPAQDNSNKEAKCIKGQQKLGQPISKKRLTPKKSTIVESEHLITKQPETKGEREIDFVQLASSPPETEDVFFNAYDFPTLDSNKSIVAPNSKPQTKLSPEVRRVLPPRISQKQRKRLSLELEDKKEKTVEPAVPKPQFKGWAIISPPTSDSFNSKDQSSSPIISNFTEIIASEQEERNNLFKLKAKPFSFTQMEDKAMEQLYEFYNAANVFDERITIHRVVSSVVARPTWIKTNKTLFH